MDELLQKHGCANVFSIPEGLKELMADISREVLREQPTEIFDFIANYLSALMLTREHGVLAMKILEDLCDCKPTVSEHLLQLGIEKEQASTIAQVIKEEIEASETDEAKENIKEYLIIKKILTKIVLDEDTTARVCQVARNAFRDYWYRKKTLEKSFKYQPEEPWETAAQHTLELYKKTRPSMSELVRATRKIQAAYRGYYVRKNLLGLLKPKPMKARVTINNFGPPADVAASREIDLGPIIDIEVKEDDVKAMFDQYPSEDPGLKADIVKAVPDIPGDEEELVLSQVLDNISSSKSLISTYEKSKHDNVGEDRQMLASRSGGSLQSPLVSHLGEIPRSNLSSQHNIQETSTQKISIVQATSGAAVATNVIEDITETLFTDKAEVPEELEVRPEEIPESEVPEDIVDDRTDGDAESAPTASIPNSAPDTADNTDVEDDGNIAESSGDEIEEA